MSKETNKEKQGFVRQKTFFFPEVIEQDARSNLAKGKFRLAKDGFKDLCKIDKVKYLPELLACYYGMANEMIRNGQLSDAAQIADNIKALTGDKNEGSLDLLIAVKQKDYDAVARIYANLLFQGRGISDIPESSLATDALVVSFQEFPQLKSNCPEIYEELHAVQQALEDVSSERYEDAWLKVKKIAVHSFFSHWKLFIKGLVAFYKNEDQKALEAFGRISSDTLLQGMAQSYMALLDSKTIVQKATSELFLQKMCMIAGYSDIVSILPKADYLWKAGRYYDSYCHIRNSMKPFPREGSDIAGTLTRFYFNSIHHLPDKAAMNYLEDLRRNKKTVSHETDIEEVLICKAECLFLENILCDEEDDNACAHLWENFLKAHTKVFGNDNRLESLVYFHLGLMFAGKKPQEPPLFPWLPSKKDRDSFRNAHLAEHYFNKSINMDKDNKDAYLGLLEIYGKTHNNSKVNKLLDRMIPLFPNDSAILSLAGISCVDRKSYIKGIKYLEQAAGLDPLDSTIRERLGFSYIKAARACFDKGQVEQGRSMFEKAIEIGVSNAHDLNRGYAYIYARWAVLELKNKNEDIAAEKLHLAREKAAKLLPLLYFTQLISRFYELPDVYIQKLSGDVYKEWVLPPTPENAAALLMIYRNMSNFGLDWLKSETKRVVQYAFDAADKPCSRDDAMSIIFFALSDKTMKKLGDVYIKKMLQKDKDDPQFHYMKYQLQTMNRFRLPGKEDIYELNHILHLAEKRNAVELAQELKKKIKTLEELLKAADIPNYDDTFDKNDLDQHMDIKLLEKLFEEMHRTLDGHGRRKR